MSRKLKWAIAVPVALVVLVTGGTWVYINVLSDDAPPKLTLSDATGPTGSSGASEPLVEPSGGVEGTWTATKDSVVGYRVKEMLFGQSAEAAGRTSEVTGSLTIAGSSVTTTEFTVDMASITSDREQRDRQYRGRIMATDQFPTSTFKLTQPIVLTGIPSDTSVVTATATGELTLRGTTKTVTFEVKAQRSGATFKVNGSIPIVFAEWNIPNPSGGPAQTADDGLLEFLIVFAKS